MSEVAHLQAAADLLAERGLGTPDLCLVLGSGLAAFVRELGDPVVVPFADVPGWPVPSISGHGADVVAGELEGLRIVCLSGRVHRYEGWSPVEVVRAVRTLCVAGVPRFVLTNSAGGVSSGLSPGDLMVIRDHVNRTGSSPLVGPLEEGLGPRFPDMSRIYSPELSAMFREVDPDLAEGVYAGNLGPEYETPAEIRALAAAGVDAVGMSTVLEAVALHAMGAEVAGISLVSNAAAGISDRPLDHAEVLAAGQAASARLVALLRGLCARLAQEGSK